MRVAYWVAGLMFVGGFTSSIRAADEVADLGLKLPPGFRARIIADETLANDTYAMTLDAKGRVVVTTRGAVKTLHDDNGDGRLDRASLFAETESGGMGLCFDGNDLLFCGDGWLSRYRDANGDGRADGPPERLLPLVFTEHGGHAMRKGPDGFWYVIGGNDSRIGTQHVTAPRSPVVAPEAGALLRLTPDGRQSEIYADGFRNPYDFDFNAAGDLFTYDSDVERDIFLPWYAPTRLFHVAQGGHHGWRVTGYLRSWPRPGYDPGTVDVLEPVGRGSPTGVVCYRHSQFPAKYRDGLFILDWTFGKVFFVRLVPSGTTYRAQLEVFLEPTGTSGFAPTDAVVAPDGALLISIGGRRTRGAVYRIEFEGRRMDPEPATELDAVLRAPQPLDAWSRARWEPLATKLGRAAFLDAACDQARPAPDRRRAVEVATERFGGLDRRVADALVKDSADAVRARLAWSLGRAPIAGGEAVLVKLTDDPDPSVRLAALDAWDDTSWKNVVSDSEAKLLVGNLGHVDKRVRQAAARLAARSTEETWSLVARALPDSTLQARLSGALAELWRHPDRVVHDATGEQVCDVLEKTTDPDLRIQAIRLIQRALGDYHLVNPTIEVETGYSTQPSLTGHETLAHRIRKLVRPLFPTGIERLDDESARLLAMLEDDDPALPAQVAAFWTGSSSPTRDLHYLIVLERLHSPRDPALRARVARAVVALDGKLAGQEQRTKQTWNDRIGEVVGRLLERDPGLGTALLNEKGFVSPNHVALALALAPPERAQAARRYLGAVQADPDYLWSGPLIDLLAGLPTREVRPAFRSQWNNYALRDALLPRLASPPDEADRAIYLDALDSSQPDVIRGALGALESLPRDKAPAHLVPVLRLLRRLTLEPRESPLRKQSLRLFERQTGEHYGVTETNSDVAALRRAYEPILEGFKRANPKLLAQLQNASEDLAAWSERLKRVDWKAGDSSRGSKLFLERGCQTCHSGPRALGPDLTGVTDRLSREDLFTAIVAPSLDVSPLYRTTQVETRDGRVYSGTIAFESADGLILQTGATTTVRVATPDMISRHVGTRSLMPDQLLQGLGDRDLADLDQYLRSLSKRGPAR
jgi:putative membrane-bound dehydrogenase-like protein